jgi:hypothetical protein
MLEGNPSNRPRRTGTPGEGIKGGCQIGAAQLIGINMEFDLLLPIIRQEIPYPEAVWKFRIMRILFP